MQKRLDTRFQERHHVCSLLFACRKHAPKPFLPTIAPIASRSLRHLAVDHHFANRLFAEVVCRGKIFVDETKVFFLPIPQSFRNVDRVVVVRDRSPGNFQDRILMRTHSTQPIPLQKFVFAMDRRKHFAYLFQEPSTVSCDFFVLVLGKKLHFSNQMSPTKLKLRRGHSLEFFYAFTWSSVEFCQDW